MLIVCVADVVSLPATSVTTTWRSAGPSASAPVASDSLYVEPAVGAVCVPKTVKAPAPLGLISKRTAETPEAGGTGPSDAFAVTVTVPATYEAAAGEVIDPLAGVLSTVFGRPGSSSFATLPVVSVTTARRSYSPSATSVVLHEASYGGEMSAAPMFAQLLAPAGENWN